MDSSCKKAFLIVIAFPVTLFLFIAWFFLGEEKVHGGWFDGIFDTFSMMILPTILFLVIGGIVDFLFFDHSLFKCRGKGKPFGSE